MIPPMLPAPRFLPRSDRLSRLPRAICLAMGLVLASTLLLGSGPALAAIQLEAENATGFLNVGGSPITSVICGAARGGMGLDGIDWAGDYIEWEIFLPEEYSFRDSLRTAGAVGLVRTFVVQFYMSGIGGPPILSDTLVTPAGLGIG
jgi:hypothetical protein